MSQNSAVQSFQPVSTMPESNTRWLPLESNPDVSTLNYTYVHWHFSKRISELLLHTFFSVVGDEQGEFLGIEHCHESCANGKWRPATVLQVFPPNDLHFFVHRKNRPIKLYFF